MAGPLRPVMGGRHERCQRLGERLSRALHVIFTLGVSCMAYICVQEISIALLLPCVAVWIYP
jgi:hypothetical protein